MRSLLGPLLFTACLLCLVDRSALAQKELRDEPDLIVSKSVHLFSGPAGYRPHRLAGIKEFAAYADGLRACIPLLVQILMTDPDADVRAAAASALGRQGPVAREAVPQLVLALRDDREQVRMAAADALGLIGLYAREGVPALVQVLLKDKSALVRRSAARSLGNMGVFAKPGIPALLEALNDPDSGFFPKDRFFPTSVRQLALTSLGNLGPDAKEALPALLRFYQTNKEPDGGLALETAARIAKHKSLVGLCLLGLKDEKVCERAALALAALGPEAKEAVPHLLQALKDPLGRTPDLKKEFQAKAILALARIGPDAKEAIPALRELQRLDPFSRVGSMAAFALGVMEKK